MSQSSGGTALEISPIGTVPRVVPPNTVLADRQYEFIDCVEFGRRVNLPESWIHEHVRTRTVDPIPHVRFGKYVRFRWGSPELEAWIERRIVSGSNKVVGRALRKESK
jgi:hypothetical protein